MRQKTKQGFAQTHFRRLWIRVMNAVEMKANTLTEILMFEMKSSYTFCSHLCCGIDVKHWCLFFFDIASCTFALLLWLFWLDVCLKYSLSSLLSLDYMGFLAPGDIEQRQKPVGQIPVASWLFGRGINWWSLATHSVTSRSCTCGETPLWAKKTEQESG